MMKRGWLSIGFLLACLMTWGQTTPLSHPIPNLRFANFEDNQLQYPSDDSQTMERFFTLLDSSVFFGKGDINIIHIGGSHVQAGIFTQRFRDNLLSISPDLMGGKYFLFPFSVGKTNNPSHFTVKYTGEWSYSRNVVSDQSDKTFGLSGAAITTSDPEASITISTHSKLPSASTPIFKFNKITILGYSETNDVVPVLRWNMTTINGNYDEDQETYSFELPTFTDTVSICFDSVPGEFTITGILLENGLPGVSVHGIGVNGASVPSYLRCENFERDLELISPDLVIFEIGINDAAEGHLDKETFKRNYDQLIAKIQSVNPNCAFVFVSNNDSYRRVSRRKYAANPNGKLVEQAMTELAENYDAALWDLFHVMGGFKSMKDWQKAKLASKDKVHFTSDGYKLLGDLLYNAFIESYMDHVKQNTIK